MSISLTIFAQTTAAMFPYPSYVNCPTLPQPVISPCVDAEPGRVRGIAFVKQGFAFTDPSDVNEWLAGVAAGDIVVIPEVRGSYDGGSPIQSSGYGDQDTRNTGRRHTLTYMHPEVVDNVPFYQQLYYIRGWVLWYVTEGRVWNTHHQCTVSAGTPIEEDVNTEIVWNVQVIWAGKLIPTPYTRPENIFLLEAA